MNPGVRQITEEERTHLRDSFMSCESWRFVEDIWIGEVNGWRIWLSAVPTEPTGHAMSIDRNIQMELPPNVVKSWVRYVEGRIMKS